VKPAFSMLWPSIVAGSDLVAPDGVNASLHEMARKVVEHTRVCDHDYHFVSSRLDHTPLIRRFGNEDAVNWWLGSVSDMVLSTIKLAYMAEPDCDIDYACLCAIARAGDRIPAHRHSNSHFTVVYYPHVDRPEKQDRLNDGALSLINDKPTQHLFKNRNPTFQDGSAFRIHPRTGLMVLFPGYVLHETNTYPGPGERVTITTNVTIRMEREYG